MLPKIVFLLMLPVWVPIVVLAQNSHLTETGTVYSLLKARKYKIVLGTRKIIVTHSLDSLKGNYLYITKKKEPQRISVEIIKELQIAKKKGR